MTRNEKKAVIESMAEKFMNIDDLEGKSMTIMVMLLTFVLHSCMIVARM